MVIQITLVNVYKKNYISTKGKGVFHARKRILSAICSDT